jgi:Uma2 family endonuclease
MAEAGILQEDDRVELIEGEIIEMAPIGRMHSSIVDRLTELFFRTFGDTAQVHPQNPLHLSEDTEPQPDLTLLRRQPDFYASGLPGADDIFLVVEVADTSAGYDRRVKMPLYAHRGITEAWLIDLNRQTMTVYRDPSPTGYRSSRLVGRGDQVAPAAFPDRVLHVDDMLG